MGTDGDGECHLLRRDGRLVPGDGSLQDGSQLGDGGDGRGGHGLGVSAGLWRSRGHTQVQNEPCYVTLHNTHTLDVEVVKVEMFIQVI